MIYFNHIPQFLGFDCSHINELNFNTFLHILKFRKDILFLIHVYLNVIFKVRNQIIEILIYKSRNI